MNQKQLRFVIILGFAVVAAGIVGIIALITTSSDDKTATYTQTEYVDPASGETINDTQGKTPEKYGANPDVPVYYGFSILLDRGLTQDEVNEITAFVNDYNNKLITEGKEKLTEVSLYRDSVIHKIENEIDNYTMDLLINRTSGYVLQISSNNDTEEITYTLHKGASTSDPVVFTKKTPV